MIDNDIIILYFKAVIKFQVALLEGVNMNNRKTIILAQNDNYKNSMDRCVTTNSDT